MNVICFLFIAQVFDVTPLGEGYYEIRGRNMPVIEAPIPPATRILDNMSLVNPAARGAYQFPDETNGFPLKTARYGEQPRQTVPIQERLQMRQIENDILKDEISIQGAALNQTIQRKELEYTGNIQSQTAQAMPYLQTLDPQSDAFDLQMADLQKEYPLAFQNPAFNQLVGRVAQTRSDFIQSQNIADRQREQIQATRENIGLVQDVRENAREQALREQMAKYGPEILEIYNGAPDPIAGFAAAQEAILKKQQQITSEKAMTPKERDAALLDYMKERRAVKDKAGSPYGLSEEDKEEIQFYTDKINELMGKPTPPADSSVDPQVAPGTLDPRSILPGASKKSGS